MSCTLSPLSRTEQLAEQARRKLHIAKGSVSNARARRSGNIFKRWLFAPAAQWHGLLLVAVHLFHLEPGGSSTGLFSKVKWSQPMEMDGLFEIVKLRLGLGPATLNRLTIWIFYSPKESQPRLRLKNVLYSNTACLRESFCIVFWRQGRLWVALWVNSSNGPSGRRRRVPNFTARCEWKFLSLFWDRKSVV